MDLGACPKSHTERLKTEFLAAREADLNGAIFSKFQLEYEQNIFAFVDECDRRIRAAHRRLEKTPEENAKTTNLVRASLILKSGILNELGFRCVKLQKLNWRSREGPRKSRHLVSADGLYVRAISNTLEQVSKARWTNRCVKWRPLKRSRPKRRTRR
jgi:hypothetical protein